MKTYAIVKNNAFVRREFDHVSVVWDVDHVGPISNLTNEERIVFGVEDFAYTSPPTFDPLTQNCIDSGTELINGKWCQVWNVVAASPEEIRSRRCELANLTLKDDLDRGFQFMGSTWHSDAAFQSQMQGFVLAYTAGIIPNTEILYIRDKDNMTHALDKTQVTQLAGALLLYVQTAYQACWSSKDSSTE